VIFVKIYETDEPSSSLSYTDLLTQRYDDNASDLEVDADEQVAKAESIVDEEVIEDDTVDIDRMQDKLGAALTAIEQVNFGIAHEILSSLVKSEPEDAFDGEEYPDESDEPVDGKSVDSYFERMHLIIEDIKEDVSNYMKSDVENEVDDKQVVDSLDILSDAVKKSEKESKRSLVAKSISDGRIGGYAVLWGGDIQRDLEGEYFTDNTTELTTIYEAVKRVPLLYHHGLDDTIKTSVIGVVDTIIKDDLGLWYEAQLRMADGYESAIMNLLKEGKLRTSTQTLASAHSISKTGEILRWPIVEVTLTPTPAEYRMLAMPVDELKSFYNEIGCEDISCVLKAMQEEEHKNSDPGTEKVRLQLVLNQQRLALDL